MSSRAKTGMGGAITGKIVVEGGGDGDGGADRTEDVDDGGGVFVWTGREGGTVGRPAIAPWV